VQGEHFAETFLRSINIRYDALHPERIAHFHPTTKSVDFLKALAGFDNEKAFIIVAPYGTGKSLAATYLLHLIENCPRSKETLAEIGNKLNSISPDLSSFSKNRNEDKRKHGVVIALNGYCRSLGDSLKEAAIESMERINLGREATPVQKMSSQNIDQALNVIKEVKKKAHAAKNIDCDRIIILWDEFGRHIESSLDEGRSSALLEIQTLAEYVSRSKDLPMTLGLFLHRGLLHYAGNMPQTVRMEWKKIEGRFNTIQYFDDSKEIYKLIGEVISSRRSIKPDNLEGISAAAAECKGLGLFNDISEKELAGLFRKSFPLEPMTLFLLPRLSARIAQNERTLFNFLYSVDLGGPVGPDRLYDYFSVEMQNDFSVGGTYRQWVEAQSALSKVGDDSESSRALKSACLIGLGINGERSRSGYNLLRFAQRGLSQSGEEKDVIGNLIEKKLLIHRKHSDDVAIWHGTDVDLRGKLEEEKQRTREQFDLLEFIAKEAPPPAWRPIIYNAVFGVRRYIAGEYVRGADLRNRLGDNELGKRIPIDCDGKIYYVIPETSTDIKEIEDIAVNYLKHDRLFVAIPSEALGLFEAALEVWCLDRMQYDANLTSIDPLITPELQQMHDDARGHLKKQIERLVRPSTRGARWFYNGSEFNAFTQRQLINYLSGRMNTVYCETPKINNEMIVRKKPSRIVVNAKKKLLLGILERSGTENLGILGNFPDASMFRTVLMKTGLYRQGKDGRWFYGQPEDITDPGLKAIWRKIRDFLTCPEDAPKDFQVLFNELMEPPYGVRHGLLSILFAAGLRAFPSAISISKDGKYLFDLLPSDVESICNSPSDYKLHVMRIDQGKDKYLHSICRLFSTEKLDDLQETDLIRKCYDSLETWKAKLPPATMTTNNLSDVCKSFRDSLYMHSEPIKFLFDIIPKTMGCNDCDYDSIINKLKACRDELMNVTRIYIDNALGSINNCLGFSGNDDIKDVRKKARKWATSFSEKFINSMNDGVDKSLIKKLHTDYASDKMLVDSVSILVIGKAVNRWDDNTPILFDRELKSVIHRIEDMALSSNIRLTVGEGAAKPLVGLVQARIAELFNRLVSLVGESESRIILSNIIDKSTGAKNADDERSIRKLSR